MGAEMGKFKEPRFPQGGGKQPLVQMGTRLLGSLAATSSLTFSQELRFQPTLSRGTFSIWLEFAALNRTNIIKNWEVLG